MKKEHYAILVLLGVGAIILLLHLQRRTIAVAAGSEAPPAPGPEYPNSEPIKLGNVEVGASPTYLTINTVPGGDLLPQTKVVPALGGDCACTQDPCDAFLLRSTQQVPESVLKSAQENFLAFESKLAGATLGSPAPADAVVI